jgi:hypothetical protein
VSLKVAVAAPFRHMRKERLQKTEFIFYIAIDRKWMNKDQANLLIERGCESGLLESSGGWIVPLFNIEEVTIPLGFKPGSDIFAEENPCDALIGRISAATGKKAQAVVGELNTLIADHFDGNLRVEAAAVILAKKYRVPYEDLLDPLLKSQKNRR